MKLKSALISFLLIYIYLVSPNKVSAVSCCGDSRFTTNYNNDPKVCWVYFTDCSTEGFGGTALKACDKANDVKDQDLNGDGFNDEYNTDCFVNIQAPSEVKITDFGRLFSGAVSFLLLIAFILAFFYLILGGISWLTSGGDKANIETARNKIIAAIIGLIIVAATWALFGLIGGAIGFNILGGFELPTLY